MHNLYCALVGSSGLEPPTSRLSGVRSNHLSYEPIQLSPSGVPSPPLKEFGGDEEDRTPDPLLAGQVLSQLSYTPNSLPLKAACAPFESPSRPSKLNNSFCKNYPSRSSDHSNTPAYFRIPFLLRKEVIQPHLPIRLPCYDFTLIINPTFGSALLAVRLLTSGVTDSHGVTGGVYKTRERIHRGMLIRDY